MKYSLAIDIGGTKVAMALIDQSGKVAGEIQKAFVPFEPSGVGDAKKLIETIQPFVDQSRQQGVEIIGLGLSLCGIVDEVSGEAVLTSNLHWRNLPFAEMLHNQVNLPVYAAADVRQAALAEHVWGIAKNIQNFAWCTVGTGYGGYLFLNGRLYGGAHCGAGNFGHMTLDEIHGEMCGCGRRGCYETYVAGPAIARNGQAAVNNGSSPKMAELAAGSTVTTRIVIQAYKEGDEAAIEIINQVIRLIAINLSGVVNTLDLEMIVMGGGVATSTPDFVKMVDNRIREYLMTEEAKRDLKVVTESFCNAALIGAGADVFVRSGILSP